MPMNKSLYPWYWRYLSWNLRHGRAKDRCEQCGAVNGAPLPSGWVVILTVHHLGIPKPDGTHGNRNDKSDCREENLIVLCQRCHLLADQDIRIANARETRRRKRIMASGQGVLLDVKPEIPR